MGRFEQKIKDFVKEQGVNVVGLAGPERLDGPPSLDPTYTMKGARSIVSLAVPMDVNAIYDFLSKKCQSGHNVDQLIWNQKLHHISTRVAKFLESQGYRARAVPSNNTYRRSPDIFATHPSFSHRFGAIAAGIGAQGFSGNVMTKEYGAAVYLGTVVTDAVLESDPALPSRYFIDNYCYKCRACAMSCVARMFIDEEEEYILLNNELHPRGKRRDINFCNASCFGLHNLSEDKKWSSWGRHWIGSWIEQQPDPEKHSIRNDLLKKGATVGDSTARYRLIMSIGAKLYPEEYLDPDKLGRPVDQMPEDELERRRFQAGQIKQYIGMDIDDANVLTCGQCALVCGPDVPESMKRLKMLREGGIVVPGKDGRMQVAESYEEALRIKQENPVTIPFSKKAIDVILSTFMWIALYGGFEPKSIFGNRKYQRRRKKAVADRITGHKSTAATASQTESAVEGLAN
ncbi:MAG: hypothetical protein R6U29_06015 [Desulfosudaceae bacterium]